MDPFSSLPESQQGQQNHDRDNRQLPSLSARASSSPYYYQQSQQQYYAYNPPPAYVLHQVPLEQNVEAAGDLVNAGSGGGMLQVGINPVAVAAAVTLSQLSQLASPFMQANLGAAQLSNGPTLVPPPLAAVSPYNNSGRRGRGAFGGNGRGCNCQCLLQIGDHGTGAEVVLNTSGNVEHRQSHSKSLPVRMSNTDEAEALTVLPKEMVQTALPLVASHSTAAEEKGPSRKRPPQSSVCELCRVECNNLEMLEIHKNGKRHKRNLQKTEESKSALICDLCNVACGTQEVFYCHLSGKKYITKLKRSGLVGLQAQQQQPAHTSKSCSRGLHSTTD